MMGSSSAKQWHCRCGTQLAADNPGVQCAPCARASRDRFIAPPEVPPEFWQNEQLRDGFAAQHMGRIASAYRVHPYHQPTYGLHGISQRLLGQWIGLTQPQVSRIENGSPIRNLDTLAYWARTLRIPAELLWFRLLGDTGQLVVPASAGTLELPAGLSSIGVPNGTAAIEPTTDPEHDLVLVSPWSSRGTLEAAVVLGGGSRVKRRKFVLLTGTVLTAPAHQWLVHEPEPLLSGLAGHRVSGGLVTRLSAMVAELRKMDDVGGGGSVLAMAEQQFEWVAGLLDRASYDEPIGKMLYSILAELGQLAGWAAYDAGLYGLAQRYYIAALRAAHSADDRALGGFILGSMAEQSARQNRPAEAVTLIETAVAGTRGAQTPRLLAQLYNWQSYAFAVLEDTSSCNAAISRARRQAEKFEQGNDPAWLYWVNPADITAGAGQCLLRLGLPDQAAVMLDEGISVFDESFVRDRQLHLTYLSEARAQPGKQRDLDAAAGHGLTAIQLAESLESHLSVGRIHELCRLLTPDADVPAVAEFLERAKGFMEERMQA